ncbi:hypothetical protein RJ639_041300 [Escallonia herrerae]|uniref:Integrase zinc-binding domain-containing protein n=1 Tax=Escallonia herrerae TaxID=1293975 RepID=A0AA88WEW0_9ASTE|nr:hypothetical protein RJ639_041300 [Escallonia herrerae]
MMNALFNNIGQVQCGEQSGSQSRNPPIEEQTDAQDYEEEDVVGAFPQWCNAVTTPVGNPGESLTGKKPKDMPPKKKGDVPGKCLMYVDIKVNGKAIKAMVDICATHNYISSTKVERLGLTLKKGHGGGERTLALFQQCYYWPQMGDEVQEYVKTCLTCQQYKVERKKKAGLHASKHWKSAFKIVNGQHSLLPHTVNVPNTGKSPRAISFSEEWRQNIDLAHSYLEKTVRRMKKHADKNRRSQEFNVGNKVMVKLMPQDRKFLRGRDSCLLQKYEGPLTIVKKIGKMAYKVDPPHWWSRQLHPVFHVSMLKPFFEDTADPSRAKSGDKDSNPKRQENELSKLF